MKHTISIQGMHCKSCELLLKDQIQSSTGTKISKISHKTGECHIDCEESQLSQIHQIIADAGYTTGDADQQNDTSGGRLLKITRLILAAIILIVLMKTNVNQRIPSYENINFLIVFVVGLVASVSTCLAITGGIIIGYSESVTTTNPLLTQTKFHLGRLVAFMIGGGLLGLIGGQLGASIWFNVVFSILVGIVLTYLGLQLLGILPNISKLGFHLPSGLSQAIFRLKDPRQSWLVGALTFLLPCGFTQSMQLMALQSGSMRQGMLIMTAFALGTVPVLLGVGLGTNYIKDKIRIINPLIAALLVMFGIYTIYNATILTQSLTTTTTSVSVAGAISGDREIIQVGHDGVMFVPDTITLDAGKQYTIAVTPSSDGKGCNTQVVIPGKGPHTIRKGEVFEIDVDATSPRRIKLVCASMGMRQGEIVIQ